MLRNGGSGPEIGLPGQILAGLLSDKRRAGSYFKSNAVGVLVGEQDRKSSIWDRFPAQPGPGRARGGPSVFPGPGEPLQRAGARAVWLGSFQPGSAAVPAADGASRLQTTNTGPDPTGPIGANRGLLGA